MTNQLFWYRVTGRDLGLRAADADREQVAERLRKSHAEGRLDLSEFQQRLEHCYAARTLGQLRELVRDLPRADSLEGRSSGWLRAPRRALSPLVAILIVLLLASAASGHGHHFFWLWIPIAFLFWRSVRWRHRRPLSGGSPRIGDWI
jgi:hypothetical protein